jgi:3-oxoacyl-[acyl-carrier protein] reductase
VFNLTGKVALVTGASGGIGEAIAKSLHAQGATVVLSGRRLEQLEKLAKELGERAHTYVADISDKAQVEEMIDKVEALAGKVDILVCNAGITKDNIILRMKEEEWQSVLDTNLYATFVLNKNAVKKMVRRRFGRIINITSIVGVTGNPGQANYAASKAGIIGMGKSIAQEISSRGITINCVAPGFIKTAMTDVLTDDQKTKILQTIPQGDLGTPEDIAAAVVYLASEEARYVTGQTLHVNGGMVMV